MSTDYYYTAEFCRTRGLHHQKQDTHTTNFGVVNLTFY